MSELEANLRPKRLRNYRLATVIEYCKVAGVKCVLRPRLRSNKVTLYAFTGAHPEAGRILADVGFSYSARNCLHYMTYSAKDAREYLRAKGKA